jgi:hypothetical protein
MEKTDTSQKSEVRSQKSEVRSQKSEVRSQKPEDERRRRKTKGTHASNTWTVPQER